jgi:hypothetical protein
MLKLQFSVPHARCNCSRPLPFQDELGNEITFSVDTSFKSLARLVRDLQRFEVEF